MGNFEIDNSRVSLDMVQEITGDVDVVGLPPDPFYTRVGFVVENEAGMFVDVSSLGLRVTVPDWVSLVEESKETGVYPVEEKDGWVDIQIGLFTDDFEVADSSDESVVMVELLYEGFLLAEATFEVEPDYQLVVEE